MRIFIIVLLCCTAILQDANESTLIRTIDRQYVTQEQLRDSIRRLHSDAKKAEDNYKYNLNHKNRKK